MTKLIKSNKFEDMSPGPAASSNSISNEYLCPNNNQQHNNNENFKISHSDIKSNSPVSEKSHNISIVSLDDDDDDETTSSIASDSDLSECDYPTQYIVDNIKNGESSVSAIPKDGMIVINQRLQDEAIAASKPNIGSIALQNSSDITFGNKTFYHGPVTIKQFLLDSKQWKENGHENSGYHASKTDIEKTENEKGEFLFLIFNFFNYLKFYNIKKKNGRQLFFYNLIKNY